MDQLLEKISNLESEIKYLRIVTEQLIANENELSNKYTDIIQNGIKDGVQKILNAINPPPPPNNSSTVEIGNSDKTYKSGHDFFVPTGRFRTNAAVIGNHRLEYLEMVNPDTGIPSQVYGLVLKVDREISDLGIIE